MYSLNRDFASKAIRFDGVSIGAKGRKTRLYLIQAIACVWAIGVTARLYSLQVSDFEKWQDWALKQHFSEMTLASERGPVFDRNDKLLAVSVPAGSIYVRPKQIKDKQEASRALGKILNIDAAVIKKKMNEEKPFVWIERQLPRFFADKVAELNIPGIGHVLESRRFYPYNQAASTLIGKVGVDGVGLSGIESLYENLLHGEHVQTRMTRDAFGNFIDISSTSESNFELPKGEALKLTIDAGLQMIMDEELAAGRSTANSKSAMAIMVDADNGEILAMSQAPTINFNDSSSVVSKSALRNLLVETVFEPGSVMKPMVAAAAIEAGVIRPDDMLNCESGRYSFGKHTIKDVHPYAIMSFRDVLIRSSNIGMTKVGMRLGENRLYSFLKKFGFGEMSHLGIAGETRGILRPLEQWAKVDVATHSFGQGIAVTPLQMVRALSAIANGGTLPSLHFVLDQEPKPAPRIISEATAAKVREMLYGVVEDEHGTGKSAIIEGVRIGGKTGTAQKARASGRGYAPGAYVASFVGFAEASEALGIKKRLTLMVIIDEPRAKSIYGGAVAAPVFKRIMQRSLSLLSTKSELAPPPSNAKDEYRELPRSAGVTQVAYVP